MIRRLFLPFLLLALVTGLSHGTIATELTAREIVARMDDLGTVADMTSVLDMTIINKVAMKQSRTLSLTTKTSAAGARLIMVHVLAPATIKGTSLLSISKPGLPDETWLYLPALGKPRKIAAEERGGSFMGSDFTYEDMGMVKVDDYRHTLLRQEKVDGDDVYVVESVPVSEEIKNATGFAKKVWWIRKKNFTRAKAEFQDSAGKTIKAQKASGAVELKPGVWFNTVLEMSNIPSGSKTSVKFSNIRINTGIGDDFFSVDRMKQTK